MALPTSKVSQSATAEIDLYQLIIDDRKENKVEHDLLHKRISDMKDEVLSEIKELRQDQNTINTKMEERVTQLERWKWTVVGGSIVIGFLLADGFDLISAIIK